MDNRRPSRGHLVAALFYFAITSAIAMLLLLTAALIWLSQVTGSFVASALIAAGFFALLSLAIYLLAIRDAVERIRERIDTIYEVAQLMQSGYEWIIGKFSLLSQLHDAFCTKERSDR